MPEEGYTETPMNPLQHWLFLPLAIRHVWQHWKTEYLHTLQKKTKWNAKNPNIKVNEIVLFKALRSPLLQWTIGRIKVFPGSDYRIREVLVRTPHPKCVLVRTFTILSNAWFLFFWKRICKTLFTWTEVSFFLFTTIFNCCFEVYGFIFSFCFVWFPLILRTLFI